jgi:hypothetical protein
MVSSSDYVGYKIPAHRRIIVMDSLEQLFRDRIILLGRAGMAAKIPKLDAMRFLSLGLPYVENVSHSTCLFI